MKSRACHIHVCNPKMGTEILPGLADCHGESGCLKEIRQGVVKCASVYIHHHSHKHIHAHTQSTHTHVLTCTNTQILTHIRAHTCTHTNNWVSNLKEELNQRKYTTIFGTGTKLIGVKTSRCVNKHLGNEIKSLHGNEPIKPASGNQLWGQLRTALHFIEKHLWLWWTPIQYYFVRERSENRKRIYKLNHFHFNLKIVLT